MVSKTQVDRLGERLKEGRLTDADLMMLDTYRRSFSGAYESVIATVREASDLRPTGRPAKSTTSIVEKLRRESMRLTQMQDIAGCRLIVSRVHKQDRVTELLVKRLGGEVLDRRRKPSYGYRAVHLVVSVGERPIEIQVRTTLQHLWAELSEKVSDVVDPSVKYGGGPPEWRQALDMTSEGLAEWEGLELAMIPMKPRDIKRIQGQFRRMLNNVIRQLKSEN